VFQNANLTRPKNAHFLAMQHFSSRIFSSIPLLLIFRIPFNYFVVFSLTVYFFYIIAFNNLQKNWNFIFGYMCLHQHISNILALLHPCIQWRRNTPRNTRNRGEAPHLGGPTFGTPKYCDFNLRQLYINFIIIFFLTQPKTSFGN